MNISQFVEFMELNNISNIIWVWDECPFEEKHNLSHGGDEDYVILYRQDSMSERVIDRITVCDENSAYINDTKYRIGVTAHA